MMQTESHAYSFHMRLSEVGRVVSVGDGITWITGLPSAYQDEVLVIEDGSEAIVFQLASGILGAILLTESPDLCAGLRVYRKNQFFSVAVGDSLLGRVLDPVGNPLDGRAKPDTEYTRVVDGSAPPIIDRDFVNKPLMTGNKVVDIMIPVGKGQRELIIGDNGLGKTSLAVDAVINQQGSGVLCVFVLIGQKRSAVLNVIETLRRFDALSYTCLVVAEATSLPGMRFLAPFSGVAIGEHWAYAGRDVLIIFDDLTMHAQSYRELSLLLRRSPGREAFPADIFYLHSRLLERACALSPERGGGSLTALPIIETKAGDITSYIPTNLISITDGQIYFDETLFAAGVLPAIDVTRSVSRIGGNAQTPVIRKEAGQLRLSYLQFLDLEAFTRFGTRMDESTEQTIHRGQVLRTLLLQQRFKVFSPSFHLAWIAAYNDGLLDNLEKKDLIRLMDCLEVQSKRVQPQLDRESCVGLIKSCIERVH